MGNNLTYIDVGCHNAVSIRDFYNGKFFDMPSEGVSSIGIDPLKKFKKEWEDTTKEYNTTFINKAAYISDYKIDFSEKEQEVKSSIMQSKLRFDTGNIYKVDCFDFSAFVERLKEDVIIRMDIEGAEYPVLLKMIRTGSIKKVKFLAVEWHAHKMTDHIFREVQEDLVIKLNKLNIKWKVLD